MEMSTWSEMLVKYLGPWRPLSLSVGVQLGPSPFEWRVPETRDSLDAIIDRTPPELGARDLGPPGRPLAHCLGASWGQFSRLLEAILSEMRPVPVLGTSRLGPWEGLACVPCVGACVGYRILGPQGRPWITQYRRASQPLYYPVQGASQPPGSTASLKQRVYCEFWV